MNILLQEKYGELLYRYTDKRNIPQRVLSIRICISKGTMPLISSVSLLRFLRWILRSFLLRNIFITKGNFLIFGYWEFSNALLKSHCLFLIYSKLFSLKNSHNHPLPARKMYLYKYFRLFPAGKSLKYSFLYLFSECQSFPKW